MAKASDRHSRYGKAAPSHPQRRSFLAVGAAALGATGALAALNRQARAQAGTIAVGAALPLTGWAAADGIEYQRGFTMACDDINALGGVLGRTLTPVFEDTAAMGAENTVQAMQRLIDRHGVHAIVNGYNIGTQSAEFDVVADAGIVFIHYNTDSSHGMTVRSDPERYARIFMGCQSEYYHGQGVLKFVADLQASGQFQPANAKVAIVTGTAQYSVTIANAVKDLAPDYGYEIGLFETVTTPITQWGPTLTKIRQDPPAVIVVTHYAPQDLAQFMLQFAPDPTPSLVYMQYGPSLPAFREIAGEASEGVTFATMIAALPDDYIGKPFAARYKERWGQDASHLVGAVIYDGVMQWALASAIAGGSAPPYEDGSNDQVAKVLRRFSWRGISGSAFYDNEENAAFSYPTEIADPSLGIPHQYLQIQSRLEDAKLIAPAPYAEVGYMTPRWMKG